MVRLPAHAVVVYASHGDVIGSAVVGVAKLVTGTVLKLDPRKRSPIAENGSGDAPLDVTVSVPVKSLGMGVVLGNICVTNFETC